MDASSRPPQQSAGRTAKAPASAKLSVELLSFALDKVHEAAYLIDEEGRLCWVNGHACQSTGYTEEELLGMSVCELDPDLPLEDWPALWQLLVDQQSLEFERRHRRSDGSAVPVEVYASYFEYGAKAYDLALVRDITERKQAEAHRRAEETLRASEARMRLFFDRQLVGMAFTAPDKRWVEVNDRLCAMLGYSREELMRLSWADLTYPDDLGSDLAQFERLQRGDLDGYALEKRFVRRDGEIVYTNLSVGCVRTSAGALELVLALVEDITERKRAEQSVRELNEELARRADMLEAVNKELEAFSYTVSHDLRAPLRAVLGFAGMVREKHAEEVSPQAARLLDSIERNAVHMASLIDNLLAFSRMSRQALRCRMVVPESVIGPIVAQLRGALPPSREVEVVLHPLPACQADPAMLVQLFVNLLSNAFKYTATRELARIEIGASDESPEGEVVYYVRDNGVGFDMRYRDRLFRVFERLHSMEAFEGVGAGLAIVKRIATRHGGRVWAHGEVDRGATFYVALPCASGT